MPRSICQASGAYCRAKVRTSSKTVWAMNGRGDVARATQDRNKHEFAGLGPVGRVLWCDMADKQDRKNAPESRELGRHDIGDVDDAPGGDTQVPEPQLIFPVHPALRNRSDWRARDQPSMQQWRSGSR